MFVIRVENPCNSCVTLCENLERNDPVGYILFGVLRPCKGLLHEGKKLGRRGQTPGVNTHSRRCSRPSREESIHLKFEKTAVVNSSKKGQSNFP